MEFCAWTLFHKDSKEVLTQSMCRQALKRPSAPDEVDIIKSENDLRFKSAVFLTICLEALDFCVEGKRVITCRSLFDSRLHLFTQLLKTTIRKERNKLALLRGRNVKLDTENALSELTTI